MSRRPSGGGLVADLSSQSQLRGPGRGGPAVPSRDRCAGQQCRGVLEHPPRHPGRARAHLRAQPSRAVPAHQPAPRPDEHSAGRGSSRSPRTLTKPDGSTSRISRQKGPTPEPRPTTSPSWPTCCSPTSWPAGRAGTRVTANAFTPAWCALASEPRTPPASSGCSYPLMQPFMKSPGAGRRHLHPPGVRPRARKRSAAATSSDGKRQEVRRTQLRPGSRRAAVAGERRAGRPDGNLTARCGHLAGDTWAVRRLSSVSRPLVSRPLVIASPEVWLQRWCGPSGHLSR